jgi:histidine triad (HIT) family protein
MTDCLFCKIISRHIPARVVYEDETMLAFEDIKPQAPVHILLIPKDHFSSLVEATEERSGLLGRLLLLAKNIARQKNLEKTGYRIVLNTGRDSGQEVGHLHFHLLGGRRMTWPPG